MRDTGGASDLPVIREIDAIDAGGDIVSGLVTSTIGVEREEHGSSASCNNG